MHPAQAQAILSMIDGLSQQLGMIRNLIAGGGNAGVMAQATQRPQLNPQQLHQQRLRHAQEARELAAQEHFTSAQEDAIIGRAIAPPPIDPSQPPYLGQPQPQWAEQQAYAQPQQGNYQGLDQRGFAPQQTEQQFVPPQMPANQQAIARLFAQAAQAAGQDPSQPPYLQG